MQTSRNDTSMLSAMNEQGVFTLIFRDDEMLKEFRHMVSMFNRSTEELIVTEIGESGRTFEVERVPGRPTCWELTMHKYLSFANTTMTDQKTGKKYEPVVFTPLRIVATSGEAAG